MTHGHGANPNKADTALPSKAGWVNAILIPVKQHIGCCVLLPLATNAMGGSAAAWLASEQAEIALFAAVPPLVTYGVMKAEQKIHQFRHNRKHACACAPKTLTPRTYLKQTALAYLFYAATHLVTHAVVGHDHHGHDTHDDRDKEAPAASVGLHKHYDKRSWHYI